MALLEQTEEWDKVAFDVAPECYKERKYVFV